MMPLHVLLFVVVMIATTTATTYSCDNIGLSQALLSNGGTHELSCTPASATIVVVGMITVQNTAAITLDCKWGTIRFSNAAHDYIVFASQVAKLTILNAKFVDGPAIDIQGAGGVLLQDITLTGSIINEGGVGAYFINSRVGTLDVLRCSFYNYLVGVAIGIQATLTMSRVYCSTSGRMCIAIFPGADVAISYSTLLSPGAIYNQGGVATVKNSIFSYAAVIGGSTTSGGYNVFQSWSAGNIATDTQLFEEFKLSAVTQSGNHWIQTPISGFAAVNHVTDASPPADIIGVAMRRGAPDAGAVESDLYSGVKFSQSSYSATEGQGTFSVTISKPYRSGVSVSFSCSTYTGGVNGTATSGVDFSAVSNQVKTWNANDLTDKACVMNIPNIEYLQKPSRTFTVTLTSSNADLLTTTTKVTINDNDVACSANSSPGVQYCVCNSGYSGKNGTGAGVCTDIDECATSTDNCSATGSSCTNTLGSFYCNCTGTNVDIRRDGTNCIACATLINCNGHGTCNSTANCNCGPGYSPTKNCSTCSANFYGSPCKYCLDSFCSGHGSCNITSGACSCAPGFTGTNCTSCLPSYYGPQCTYCQNSYCSGHGSCNATNGACSCAPGFTGTNCTSCLPSYYGPQCTYCQNSYCSGHGSCNITSGACSCAQGFTGANCTSCLPNYYGPECTYCDNSMCVHGSCSSTTGGCQCDSEFNPTSNCSSCTYSYYGYPNCKYCIDSLCSGHGSCNVSNGDCSCDQGFTGTDCSTCVINHYGPSCSFCDAAIDCNGNGDCATSGGCQCHDRWGDDNCSVRTLLPSGCNITASLVARLGGNWTNDNSSYQLYDIIVTNIGNKSLSSIYLYLGDSNSFSQYWNLDSLRRNDSFLSVEGQNVTGYDLLNFYEILPSGSWRGAGLVAVDEIPFIFQIGCPVNTSLVIMPTGCGGLLVSSQLINGSTYIQDGVPHSQYSITVTNIGSEIISDIFLNITTTSGSYVNNIYNLAVAGNSSIYQHSLFGNLFTAGMSYNSSGFTLVHGGAVSVTCSSLRIVLPTEGVKNNGKGTNKGAIIGGVIGGIVGLALLGLIAYFVYRKNEKGPVTSPSMEPFTVTGSHKNKARFGLSELGTGYSMRNIKSQNLDDGTGL